MDSMKSGKFWLCHKVNSGPAGNQILALEVEERSGPHTHTLVFHRKDERKFAGLVAES